MTTLLTMDGEILVTKNAPRRSIVRGDILSASDSVRAYVNSPEDAVLQLRMKKEYVSVALYPAELRALAARLIECADGIEGRGPKP